jgi:hypothetical protein
MEYAHTSPNRTVTASPPSAARATKNRSRATPFMRFFSATFGAGVVAAQRPITRPKRQLQPERYTIYLPKFSEK